MDTKQIQCAIRPWRLEDAEHIAAMLNDPQVLDNLRDGLPYPYTPADAREYITSMLEADPEKVFAFAIVVEDKAVGSIGVFRQENIHFRTAELGYYIGRPYWGRGVMTSAVRQTVEYVFQHSDILKVFAEPFAKNAASCRVLEKAGFTLEGVLRSHAVKHGEILDMKLYARLKHETVSEDKS